MYFEINLPFRLCFGDLTCLVDEGSFVLATAVSFHHAKTSIVLPTKGKEKVTEINKLQRREILAFGRLLVFFVLMRRPRPASLVGVERESLGCFVVPFSVQRILALLLLLLLLPMIPQYSKSKTISFFINNSLSS